MSFTADPTPAFARGSEPMVESVHGAITFAMPIPINIVMPMRWNALTVGWNVERSTSETVINSRPKGHDDLVADLGDEATRQWRKDHHHRRLRQEHRTGFDRRVAEHGLQVLRQHEQGAEQCEEHERDRTARRTESRILAEVDSSIGWVDRDSQMKNEPSSTTPRTNPPTITPKPQP